MWVSKALFLLALTADPGVRGRVLYDGPVPVPQRLPVEVNQDVCGQKRPILSEQLVVSKDFGLANTAVVLLGVPEAVSSTEAAVEPAVLNQENCVFSPHVQTVTRGAELSIGNSDPVIHNVHARLGETTVFNLGMPLRGVRLKRSAGGPGVVSLRCDSGHTWMEAYVIVVPHRFHATTDRDGNFTIPDVAPGRYTLRAWHEKLGVLDIPVEVSENAGAEVRLTYRSTALRTTVAALEFTETKISAPEIRAPASSAEREQRSTHASWDTDLAAGRTLYGRYCAACHGDGGSGAGEAAGSLKTRPRDFRRGEYKFRSTKSGALPTEDDLFRTISAGIPGTDMPAWKKILSPAERKTLARYVTTFSPRFLSAAAPVVVAIPPETPNDAASIRRGHELYLRLQCAQCHGTDGRAEGASQKMFDDWGAPIDASDLTRGVYKSGPRSEDRYRTLVTGLSGTPMPSFSDLIGPEETWDLVHYLGSLAERGGLRDLLGVP